MIASLIGSLVGGKNSPPSKELIMANTQLSWNGQTQESRGSPKLHKPETENRGEHNYQPHPGIESIKIFAGMASPDGTLMIVADGKQKFYTVNRRQIWALAKELFRAMEKLEPGT